MVITRIVRGVLVTKKRVYSKQKAFGFNTFEIIIHHIIPEYYISNSSIVYIVYCTGNINGSNIKFSWIRC